MRNEPGDEHFKRSSTPISHNQLDGDRALLQTQSLEVFLWVTQSQLQREIGAAQSQLKQECNQKRVSVREQQCGLEEREKRESLSDGGKS